jgi:hypothetical protein
MAEQQSGLFAVDAGLVRETLVGSIAARVEERRADTPPPQAVVAILEAEELPPTGDDRELDRRLRHAGYHTRAVEVELFEPARGKADWVPDLLRERFARTTSWPRAVAGACADLSASEPHGKPSPDDEAAMSWRVPGPGGHVRHYVARWAIEEYLQGWKSSPVDDPAELKRPWLYGFFVRTCEEALPPEAVLGTEE